MVIQSHSNLITTLHSYFPYFFLDFTFTCCRIASCWYLDMSLTIDTLIEVIPPSRRPPSTFLPPLFNYLLFCRALHLLALSYAHGVYRVSRYKYQRSIYLIISYRGSRKGVAVLVPRANRKSIEFRRRIAHSSHIHIIVIFVTKSK